VIELGEPELIMAAGVAPNKLDLDEQPYHDVKLPQQIEHRTPRKAYTHKQLPQTLFDTALTAVSLKPAADAACGDGARGA
jgi:hypothetical protein